MSHIFHRSLISHEPEIQQMAEVLVHTYGTHGIYPDTVGEFWEPFHHNYAYGMTKIQVVANILNAMKVGDIGNFALWYDKHMKGDWRTEIEGNGFETWFRANAQWGANVPFPNIRDLVNQDQIIVRFAEHKMLDQEELLNAGNTAHLLTYGISLFTMFFIFGFNVTMNITLWLVVLGVVVSEGMSRLIPVSGSSVISFEVTGAILMGMWQKKSWGVFDWFTFLFNLYAFFAPLIIDPPLPSKFFLVGKSIMHVAHYVGTAIGVVVVKFVA